MKILSRLWTHLWVLTRARRNRSDLPSWLIRRPQLALAVGFYESALLAMGRVDPELKTLATAKASMVVNCEFCRDIGSAIARHQGVSESKLRALSTYDESPLFTDLERLVIGYAHALSSTPAVVTDEMRSELVERLSRAELAELTAEITWENQRARLNQGLGVRPAGFTDGTYCLAAEPH